MPNASIGGLASGLDTASIINQLMQLEAIPQAKLENRVQSEQNTVQVLQNLNSRLASLVTRSADLAKPETWSPLTATSSNEAVTVTASAGSAAGALSFEVNQLATPHRVVLKDTAALTAQVAGGMTSMQLTVNGGDPQTITTDGTLAGLADALNASGTGVRATLLNVGDGTHRLSIATIETGAAASFTLTDTADPTNNLLDGDILGGDPLLPTSGQDATITVDPGTSYAMSVTSATNTFADIVDGVDITVSAAAVDATEPISVAFSRDTAKATETAKAFVDDINKLLSDLDRLMESDPSTKSTGVLAGVASVRGVRDSLLDSVWPTDGTSMAGIGLETDRYGKLVFDEEAFTDALEDRPAAVTESFGSGFAGRIEAVAKRASDEYEGTITSTINGRNDSIERMEDSIADWDLRLELRRQSLTRQYTALEVALSEMQSQGSWLAGQIGSLNANWA